MFHPVDEVHTKKTGHEGREHHDDGHHGKRTHHIVHVIVDDALVGIHRGFENVRIDTGRLPGLCHLDVHVFNQVGIQLIHLKFELQFGQQGLITPDGGIEIRE